MSIIAYNRFNFIHLFFLNNLTYFNSFRIFGDFSLFLRFFNFKENFLRQYYWVKYVKTDIKPRLININYMRPGNVFFLKKFFSGLISSYINNLWIIDHRFVPTFDKFTLQSTVLNFYTTESHTTKSKKNIPFYFILKNSKYFSYYNLTKIRHRSVFLTTNHYRFLLLLKRYYRFSKGFYLFRRNYNLKNNTIFKKKSFQTMYLRKQSFRSIYIKKIYFGNHFARNVRNFRNLVNIIFELKLKYQHRLTRYLFKFKYFSYNVILNFFFFRLNNILERSSLVIFKANIQQLINKHHVYLNGMVVKNLNIQVMVGDFISLLVSWNTLIFLKYNFVSLFNFKYELNKFFFRYISRRKKQRTIQYWFNKYRNIYTDVPLFMELDYLTLSFFIIYSPNLNYLMRYSYYNFLPLSVIFNLNWKFIL